MNDVATASGSTSVRIVHISDTHGRHADLALPPAEMLIHTGDFCEDGTDAEWASFNLWLGEIKPNYRWLFVVMGNHDYKFLDGITASDILIETLATDEKRRAFLQAKLSNAVVLDNEQLDVAVGEHSNLNLTLYASPWNPWQSSPTHADRVMMLGGRAASDHDRVFEAWSSKIAPDRKATWNPGEASRYDEIPPDIDILLTHVPPLGVFDRMPVLGSWGSSEKLLAALKRAAPRAHLFGHVHAQRGYWEKASLDDALLGGVQYAKTTYDKEIRRLFGAVSGVQFVANTALMSDRTVQPLGKKKIAGLPRLIRATWTPASEGSVRDPSGSAGASGPPGQWHFHDMDPM